MKGKNFSCNNVGGKRRAGDYYPTPYSITQQFIDLNLIHKESSILEPCCGEGYMSMVLKSNGFKVIESDLCQPYNRDFLKSVFEKTDWIVTNPPFSLAKEFIEKAKTIATIGVAMLLPLSYLHGKKRYDELYSDKIFGLESVHVFTRYPMLGDLIREDGMYRTGMIVYAWYVWINGYSGNPYISWIDNNDFILSNKKTVKFSSFTV